MNSYIGRIITVALFFIPICGSISLGPFISISDPSASKEFLIVLAILSIGILALLNRECQNTPKTFINWPLYALILFLPLSIYCAPPIKLLYHHENMGGLWMWKSLAWVFLYWILYEALIRAEINQKSIRRAIGWAAIITSGYAIIQILGMDQFQFTRHHYVIGSPKAAHITGVIGNPTYLAVWLVMCLPFIFAYGKWPYWILVGFVVVMCKSDIGLFGLFFSSGLMFCMRMDQIGFGYTCKKCLRVSRENVD